MAGLVDAHVHIESSMLTPQHFGELVIKCGTIATVSDPHEIANVMGSEGIDFMLKNAELSPLKHFFTIPSCVPTCSFDVSGAIISSYNVEQLAASGNFVALSEMMNIPGVLYSDPEVMAKLDSAKKHNLPIDGHAPLVVGDDIKKYISAGISTDHETISLEESLEKLANGMKIIIREGSAAKNYNALHTLISSHKDELMFCTDDSHPDDLLEYGEIDNIIRKGLKNGYSIFDLLQIASTNAIEHYNLDIGNLKVGDKADFIVVENLENLKVKSVFIDGIEKFNINSKSYNTHDKIELNNFNHDPITEKMLKNPVRQEAIPIIGIIKDEIVTNLDYYTPNQELANLESDLENDILKIVYINRYNNTAPQISYCKGFGFKQGAIASSICHDSHNIVAVGTNDKELTLVINKLINNKGGLAVSNGKEINILPLPIAGIMSDKNGETVANDYREIQKMVKEMGSKMSASFMTLSFLTLVVIPFAKIGENGLFDYSRFDWVNPN